MGKKTNSFDFIFIFPRASFINKEISKYRAKHSKTTACSFRVLYNKHVLDMDDLTTLDGQNWINDQAWCVWIYYQVWSLCKVVVKWPIFDPRLPVGSIDVALYMAYKYPIFYLSLFENIHWWSTRKKWAIVKLQRMYLVSSTLCWLVGELAIRSLLCWPAELAFV